MGRLVAALVACVACGRIGFDGRSDGDAAIDPTLIAWYPFDEAPSPVYRDATGHGRVASCDGVILACPSTSAGPHGGRAARFDGATQAVKIMPALDLPPPYTISLWVLPERTPDFFDSFVGRPDGSSTEDTYALDLFMDGTVEFFSPVQQHLHGNVQVAIGSWVHVAATYDGAVKTLYVAGAVDKAMPFAGTIPSDAHPTYLGTDEDNGALAGFLQGSLSDVRFYARVLSAAELSALAAP